MRRLPRVPAVAALALALAMGGGMGCQENGARRRGEAPASSRAAPSAAATTKVGPGGASAVDRGSRPASITDAQIAVVEAIEAAASRFADDLLAAGGDCKRATEAIKGSGRALARARVAGRDVRTELEVDPAAGAWLDATYRPRLTKAISRADALIEQCRADETFAAALAEIDPTGARRRELIKEIESVKSEVDALQEDIQSARRARAAGARRQGDPPGDAGLP
jgi:hypothetical protein